MLEEQDHRHVTCDSSNGKLLKGCWNGGLGSRGTMGRGEMTDSSVGNAGQVRQPETAERC